jgi:hypothetical protein
VILGQLRRLRVRPERAYIDVGGHEGSHAPTPAEERRWSAGFPYDARRVRDALVMSGLVESVDLRFVMDPDAIHHESAWARRLPDALRFLFGAVPAA